MRHNVHEVPKERNVRLFSYGLNLCGHCKRREQAVPGKGDETFNTRAEPSTFCFNRVECSVARRQRGGGRRALAERAAAAAAAAGTTLTCHLAGQNETRQNDWPCLHATFSTPNGWRHGNRTGKGFLKVLGVFSNQSALTVGDSKVQLLFWG
jgi:hypothetical protein